MARQRALRHIPRRMSAHATPLMATPLMATPLMAAPLMAAPLGHPRTRPGDASAVAAA